MKNHLIHCQNATCDTDYSQITIYIIFLLQFDSIFILFSLKYRRRTFFQNTKKINNMNRKLLSFSTYFFIIKKRKKNRADKKFVTARSLRKCRHDGGWISIGARVFKSNVSSSVVRIPLKVIDHLFLFKIYIFLP